MRQIRPQLAFPANCEEQSEILESHLQRNTNHLASKVNMNHEHGPLLSVHRNIFL